MYVRRPYIKCNFTMNMICYDSKYKQEKMRYSQM